jgi:hypothetical protein
MPSPNATTRQLRKTGDAAIVEGAESPQVAWRDDEGRLLVDVGQIIEPSAVLDPSIPGFAEWMKIRQTLTVFPFPRGNRTPMAEGVVREELECHAVELGRRCDIRMIVDRRLERLLPDASALRSAGHLLPSVINTNWTEELPHPSKNRWSKFFSQQVLGRKQKVPPSASRRNERIEVGLGVIRTESGRQRERQSTVTMVFHEPNSSDRIEVRIVGLDRVVRLRFDSRRDPRFQIFWPRWLG